MGSWSLWPAVVALTDIGGRGGSSTPAVQTLYAPCAPEDSLRPLGNGRNAEIVAAKLGENSVCVAGSSLFEVES